MNFEYAGVRSFTADIEIDKVGNCCIEAINNYGALYYLLVKTNDYGETEILEYGPVVSGGNQVLTRNFSCNFIRMDYSEPKIMKTIASFLNDSKKEIYQANEIDFEEALNNFPEVKGYFSNLYERNEDTGLDR